MIAIDILEHFDTAPGLDFLAHCRRIARRAALVSTPKEFHAQEVEANPLENHRSVWSQAQLSALGSTWVYPAAAKRRQLGRRGDEVTSLPPPGRGRAGVGVESSEARPCRRSHFLLTLNM